MTARELRALWNQYRACLAWFADPSTLRAIALECWQAAQALPADRSSLRARFTSAALSLSEMGA